MKLAAALKRARLAPRFDSQGKLTKHLHLSRPVINKAESASAAVPSDTLLVDWAGATGADLGEFIELAQRANKYCDDFQS